MEKENALVLLKNAFKKVISKQDGRTKLSHINLIVGLVFCFNGDSKTFSLEAIRRFIIANFGTEISRSSFWERLSRKRLKNMLKMLIGKLVIDISTTTLFGADLLLQLGVGAIWLIDSSSITLWDGSADKFPGTRTRAGIKWHACFDILSGGMTWFETTSTSVNDRKCFPKVDMLSGKLIIFDLGYWDYGLLIAIEQAKGFFLSRVKTNSAIVVKDVVAGISHAHRGARLSLLSFQKRVGEIVELLVDIEAKGITKEFRVIGFWNPTEKKYHWYVTNLGVAAAVIYPLYKMRWQLELIFKGCKRSFNLDGKLTSNNENIVESLVLATIIASLAATVVLKVGRNELNEEQQTAVSFQRVCMITALLARHFINFIVNSSRKYLEVLNDQIRLLSAEIFEKNFRRRPTTMQRLANELEKAL